MDFRVISLPPFKAASSPVDPDFDFSPNGILGKFSVYFSAIRPEPRDDFRPRDFLTYDSARKGLVWMWALAPGMDSGGYEIVDFDGGMYVVYHYKDGDEQANARLYKEAMDFIRQSPALESDERPGHYGMGHIITPPALIKAQGWAQMETFLPVRLRAGSGSAGREK